MTIVILSVGPPLLGLWPVVFFLSLSLRPSHIVWGHGSVSVSLWCSGVVLNGAPKSPPHRSDLTHLVVVGNGCFTQLSFEIQLKGEVQVALRGSGGGGERREVVFREVFFREGGGAMIEKRLQYKKESAIRVSI